MSGLRTICKYANVNNPFELIDKGLEWIEDITEEWIRAHEHKLAPKHLNMVYCAIKTWCKATRLIKNRRLFREIDFDKTSRKTEALMETMITTKMVRQIFEICDIGDKVDIGLYVFCGLRPSLIPQLRIKHFHERSAHVENGKLVIDRKPALLIVTRLGEDGKPRRGNKGNITFFVFVPTKICELIETRLNTGNDAATSETRIGEARSHDSIYFKVKQAYRRVGFKGRPYLLRSYADRILERITREYNEEDLKEFLMGHKGKVSAIYQIKGLTEEDEKLYRDMHSAVCDKWINENIFGTHMKEDINKAEMLIRFAKQLGANGIDMAQILEAFKESKIDINQFEARLAKRAIRALDNRMMRKFEQLYLKMESKHNNH